MTDGERRRSSHFWTGESLEGVPPKERLRQIINYHLRHEVKTRSAGSLADAMRDMSVETGIPVARLNVFFHGTDTPTSDEMDAIRSGLNWSAFFAFGLSEAAVEGFVNAYLKNCGAESPTARDRKDAEVLYSEIVERIRLEMDQGSGEVHP